MSAVGMVPGLTVGSHLLANGPPKVITVWKDPQGEMAEMLATCSEMRHRRYDSRWVLCCECCVRTSI